MLIMIMVNKRDIKDNEQQEEVSINYVGSIDCLAMSPTTVEMS